MLCLEIFMCRFFGLLLVCFFCKQKTAYEMRISDWSPDVCSSDLLERADAGIVGLQPVVAEVAVLLVLHHQLLVDDGGDGGGQAVQHQSRRIGLVGLDDQRRVVDRLDLVAPVVGGEADMRQEIGRASCRERVCQYVWISVVAVSLKQKNRKKYTYE